MYTVKSRLKKLGIKLLTKLFSTGKGLLILIGNLTAVVVTVVLIFSIARVVFPVDIEGVEEEGATTEQGIKAGVEANPVYELAGEEIAGTINAYEPIDGALREGEVADPYSKIVLNPKRYWDIHDEQAIGNPGYIRHGFLAFNQIVDLQTGDILAFPNVNFGEEAPEYVSMQIAKVSSQGGIIALYVDSVEEKSLIAIFDITEVEKSASDTDFFQVIEQIGRGKEITGVHKVYLQVEQAGLSLGEIRFGR